MLVENGGSNRPEEPEDITRRSFLREFGSLIVAGVGATVAEAALGDLMLNTKRTSAKVENVSRINRDVTIFIAGALTLEAAAIWALADRDVAS